MRLAGYNFYGDFPTDCALRRFLANMSLMALGAHRAASRRRPCTPGPASKIVAAPPSTYPAGFGSGQRRPYKHGPQPASMRRLPPFRERLSDVEAVSTGSFSKHWCKLTTGRTNRRPGQAQPPPGIKAAPCLMARLVALRLPGLRGVSLPGLRCIAGGAASL